MPLADSNGTRLYAESTGSGTPIVFVHEFAGDYRNWENQVRYFARRYRCITFNARGYPPSDVPQDPQLYSQSHAVQDIAAVMHHFGVAKAHIVGLSMGAYATLNFGLRHPEMASALVVAGCGSGAPRAERTQFREEAEILSARLLKEGMAPIAQALAHGATRIQLQNKDPRGWEEFTRHLSEHSAQGSAYTLRKYQAIRPSLYDLEDELRQLKVPTLLAVGDEDEPCLDTNLFLKRMIPSSGLWVAPKTGHAINLEDPAAFNHTVSEFLATVERGRWDLRDPRSLRPGAFPIGKD